ncbi:MAG: HlyD family efflux transporter periplasmic adaptor subunit [Acetobacteraceae bacterium]
MSRVTLRRSAMSGLAMLLSLSAVPALAPPAHAARWFDTLPADDPDMILRRNAAPAVPQPAPPAASPRATPSPAPSGGLLYGATIGLASSVMGGIGAVVSGAGEALWETAYMLGLNPTPLPRPVVVEPLPEVTPPDETGRSARTLPPVPAMVLPAPPPPVVAAVEPPEPPQDLDPGLLSNLVFDRGARRPDGSFFVPKPLQRLFAVRTARLVAAEVPVSVKLAGRIIPDPQAHGDVEASLLGRIEASPAGLPVLGDAVRKGQILAYVAPAVGVVDRMQVRREVARLTTDIRVETENLEILKQFTFVPFRDGKIYQSEQRVAGLRRERETLLPLLQTQEVLRAPTDGVISVSTAIAGRVVHPGEKVFEIVNPKLLWVEASAPDPSMARDAQRVARASALTPEGRTLNLAFVGSGLALQQQSTPILFRIDAPPEGLRVGRPVTVTVQSENRSQRGLPVTRDALSIGYDGVQEVWEQTGPETFLPHAVRVQDLDGRSVLIVEGISEGARVVVSGVRLLAQLQ